MIIQADYFDILGVLAFAYIIFISAKMLHHSRMKMPTYLIYILLIIGVLGFAVDATIIINNFILS